MKASRICVFVVAVGALIAFPIIAEAAISLGTARLAGVTPRSGGCVSGPTGQFVQAWDIQPNETYTLRITNVSDCANGGTDPTINIRVNGPTGNMDLVAVKVSQGVYEVDCSLPGNAVCTYPVFYCTTPGNASSGFFVIRNDGKSFQVHLRPSLFDPGCENPTPILGPDCTTVATDESTWGAIKELYR